MAGRWVWHGNNRGSEFSDMQRAAVDWLIKRLGHVLERTPMYIQPVTPCVFLNWVHALKAGLDFVGVREEHEFRGPVLARRQLTHTTVHHEVEELANRGLSPEQIVDELLAIEIEVWQEQRKVMEDVWVMPEPPPRPPPPLN